MKYYPFQIKKRQQQILDVLSSKKVEFEAIDISQDSNIKDEMRKMANDATALPPQICNGNEHCGVSLTQLPKVMIISGDNATPYWNQQNYN